MRLLVTLWLNILDCWSVSTCRLPRTPMSQLIHRVWREASNNGHEYPSTSGSRFILQLWRMMIVQKDIRRPCSWLRIFHRNWIGSICGSSRAESLDLLATGVSVNGQTQPLYNVYHLGIPWVVVYIMVEWFAMVPSTTTWSKSRIDIRYQKSWRTLRLKPLQMEAPGQNEYINQRPCCHRNPYPST